MGTSCSAPLQVFVAGPLFVAAATEGGSGESFARKILFLWKASQECPWSWNRNSPDCKDAPKTCADGRGGYPLTVRSLEDPDESLTRFSFQLWLPWQPARFNGHEKPEFTLEKALQCVVES